MALFAGLNKGADFVDKLRRGKILQAEADYAYPFQQAGLFKTKTENQFLPERLRLANEHAGQVNKWYEPDMESQIGYRGAHTNERNIRNQYLPQELEALIREKNLYANNPLLKQPGAAGQIGSALYLKSLGKEGLGAPLNTEFAPYADEVLNTLKTTNNAKNAHADLDKERTRNFNWNQLPVEVRNNLVAQGSGMGVDPVKMKDYITQGLNLEQIAEKEGLDPKHIPAPIYAPTSTTKTRVQQQQQISAELDYISSALTPIIKPYANTFFGKSPKAISDMLSRDPSRQKQFGEYLGALALQNELASGRINLAGAKSGVELTKLLTQKSLAGIHQISPIRLTDTAFEAAQNKIDEILQRGAKIRTSTGMTPFTKPETEEQITTEAPSKVVKWKRDASGKLVRE